MFYINIEEDFLEKQKIELLYREIKIRCIYQRNILPKAFSDLTFKQIGKIKRKE